LGEQYFSVTEIVGCDLRVACHTLRLVSF